MLLAAAAYRLLGKMPSEALDIDVFRFVSPGEVADALPRVERRLGRRAAFWRFLVEGWRADAGRGVIGGPFFERHERIQVGVTRDEAVALAIPALRPLLGKHVELIARGSAPTTGPERGVTAEDLVAARIRLPQGSGPLSQDDIERAVAEGALGR